MASSEEVLEANKALAEQVSALSEKIGGLETSNALLKKSDSRHRTALVIFGLLGAAVTLTVIVVIYALVRVDNAADKATEASTQAVTAQELAVLVQQYQTDICEAANEGRKTEKELWDSLFAEDKALAEEQGTPITKSEQAALDRIFEKVKQAYPQRDCSKVKSGEVVTKP